MAGEGEFEPCLGWGGEFERQVSSLINVTHVFQRRSLKVKSLLSWAFSSASLARGEGDLKTLMFKSSNSRGDIEASNWSMHNTVVGLPDWRLTGGLPYWRTDFPDWRLTGGMTQLSAIWLTNWLTGWLAVWLIDQLLDRPTDWLTDQLTDWLTNWLTDWLTTVWLTDWLTD